MSDYIQSIIFHYNRADEIFNLLNQLTDTPKLTKNKFHEIISSLKDNHFIYLYLKDEKVVGMITLLIEQKLIHGGKSVGHIEDLVVDKGFTGFGIGSKLIEYAYGIAKNNKCYKIILDCKRELVPFYIKNGFVEYSVQMRKDIQ